MTNLTSQTQPDELNFDSLTRLPGGFTNYVSVIMRVLGSIASLSNPEIIHVENAIRGSNSISPRSLDNYYQLLQRMGLFVRHHDDRITLKPLGYKLLKAQSHEEQSQILAEMMWTRCGGMADMLVLFETAQRPLAFADVRSALSARFPTWKERTSFSQRIFWWAALGCLVKFDAHRYVLTEAGRQLLLAHSSQLEDLRLAETVEIVDDRELDATTSVDLVEDLIDELQAASFDGEQSQRFESALVDALSFVKDWQVEQKGRPGRSEEDALVRSLVPTTPLVLVFDTKARSGGRVTDINVLSLVEYREQSNADGAVAVAADFSDGKIVRQATDQGVTLLTVDLLSELIRLLANTPLVLDDYKEIFLKGGVVDTLPEAALRAAEQQQQCAELIAQIVFSLEDSFAHGWDEPVTAAQIVTFLFSRLKNRRFTKTAIQQTLDLLCNPVLGCLYCDETGAVQLRMSHQTFIRRLRALTDRIETVYEALSRGEDISATDQE